MAKAWQDQLTNRLNHEDEWNALGTIGGTATGTIKALVTGSAIYLTDLLVSSEGAATVTVGDGTPTSELAEIKFSGAGNVVFPGLTTPLSTTSGSALVYNTGGGTVAITASGYIE